MRIKKSVDDEEGDEVVDERNNKARHHGHRCGLLRFV